jgi:hypothetical protein
MSGSGSGSGSTRHRRRGGAPHLYNHRADVASVVRVSSDRRRVLEEVVPVENFPQTTPAHFEEDFATNAGLDAADFGYTMGDTSLEAEEQAPEDDGISVRVKAKRYQNSVRTH